MTVSEANAWLVTQSKDSKYANVEGKVYEYPQRIQYGRQIKSGDVLIVLLPSREAVTGGRIEVVGRVGQIITAGSDRLVAMSDIDRKLTSPATVIALSEL